jgi:hypothetical protein
MANELNNDSYGDRWNNGIDSIHIQANARLQSLIAEANNLPVNERIQFIRDNEVEFKDLLNKDYTQLYTKSMKGGYKQQLEEVKDVAESVGVKYAITPSVAGIFGDISKANNLTFGSVTRESTNQLYDAAMRWVTDSGDRTIQPLVFDFSTLKTTKTGSRLIASFQNDFFSSATLVNGNLAGVKRYRYAGATPERPFCQSLLSTGNPSKPYRIEEIQMMDNGQTSNVFATRGGYNCRHRWIPVAPTKADDKEFTPNPDNIQDLVIDPSNKEKVWIKKGDDYTGYIYRKVENDSYKRTSGKTQKVKTDGDKLYINAVGKSGAVA